MNLNEENYNKASKAHSLNQSVIIKGVLKKSPRQYHLDEIEKFEVVNKDMLSVMYKK